MKPVAEWDWGSISFSLAAICLFLLAGLSIFGLATPKVSASLMLGLGFAGVIAWAIQAKRHCPHCGAPYGYRFRIFKVNDCLMCGENFYEAPSPNKKPKRPSP